jgi:uncharacterized protein YceH (UPF0502 family)
MDYLAESAGSGASGRAESYAEFRYDLRMQISLTAAQARVLGALIEKEITTPEYYPLSLNALTNACNQKSNRDPVMHMEEHEVRRALNDLESQSLVRSVGDGRVTKFEHRLQDAFNFYRPEIAVICELLLRGPQTPGELRTRASRIHPFEDLESVHSALQRLAKREPPLVTVLPRLAGTKEARYAHLMGDTAPAAATEAQGHSAAESEKPSAASPGTHTKGHAERITELEAEVGQIRNEMQGLQEQFAAFRKQFE